ncbi:GroEL equatorial domain-like protein [Imleria badia]|nr:GroEL equatorial domain-like protein [Imleria badia]
MSMHIFGDGETEEKAENACLSSFVGALAVGDLVKSTPGPKSMNRILQSGSIGDINILMNISKVQDDEVGDGTTTVCVLASELLREVEKLIAMKIHSQTIVEGYWLASRATLDPLEQAVVDHAPDVEQFRQDLFNIAKTTLSPKELSQDKDYFANLAVDAVFRLEGSTDLEHIQIIKKERASDDISGFILDKSIAVNSPKRMENVKILIGNTTMDTDKIKVFGARVKVDSTGKLAELGRSEREKMKAKVEAIIAHGINCFVNRHLIYNYPESLLAEKGILVIEHAPQTVHSRCL